MSDKKSTELNLPVSETQRINWFPGHMAKALREVKKKIKLVDLVLEIRDARVPLSSGNLSLHDLSGGKPRIIALNKANLADRGNMQLWKKWFRENGQSALFVNSFDSRTLKQLLTEAKRIMKSKWATFEKKGIRHPPLRLIIVGIPNTGKSTIINRMTKRHAARTGDRPGVTKSQEWIVLGKDFELLDTPGIMPPKIETEEQGMWLCAIHAIKDEIVGKEKVATYIINFLLKNNPEGLKRKYDLSYLEGSIHKVIQHIGERLNYKKQKGEIDITKTCGQILLDFRQGLLGTCSFELPPDDVIR